MTTSNTAKMLTPRDAKRAARFVYWSARSADCRRARRRARRADAVNIRCGRYDAPATPGLDPWDVY